MREIKFRAWDGEKMDRRWKDGRLVIDASTGEAQKVAYGSTPFNVSIPQGLTLMQYTGLKDRHGVEIYEGDILAGRYASNGEVVWVRCGWEVKVGDKSRFLVSHTDLGAEVIGNIYENKELLNDQL